MSSSANERGALKAFFEDIRPRIRTAVHNLFHSPLSTCEWCGVLHRTYYPGKHARRSHRDLHIRLRMMKALEGISYQMIVQNSHLTMIDNSLGKLANTATTQYPDFK